MPDHGTKPAATAPAPMTTRDAPVTPHPGALKTFGDWAVGCDNVRRCAMTSLGEDFGVDWPKVTMTVTRAPGPRGGFDLAFDALADRSPAPDAVSIDGRRLRVVGMHLDLSGLWRRRQAAAILHHVSHQRDASPTVLMGDLNEWSAALGCLRDFGRDFAVAPTGPSFHARRPVARLDRILVSPDLAVLDCGVHLSAAARRASDHLPIWATVTPA